MSLAERELTANPPAEGDLPEGWALTTLGTVVRPSNARVEPEECPKAAYLSLEHIEAQTTKILGRGIGSDVSSMKSVFHAGDVLYGKLRPYLNKVCRPDFDGICSTDILVFPAAPAIDSQFLLHYLNRSEVVAYANHHSNGINLPRISFDRLGESELTLPPLAEQRRIVAKAEQLLAAANATRARLARVPTLLKRFRQAVLAAACSGRLTADWRQQNPDVEPASRLLERILAERRAKWEGEQRVKARKRPSGTLEMDLAGSVVEPLFRKQQVSSPVSGGAKYQEPAAPDVSELPELPEEWCWTSLGQCFRVCVGATPSRKETSYWNGAIPWVSSGEVQFNRISATKEYITESGLRNSSTQVNPIGSVLLGMIGEGKTRGQAAILATEACNNQNCAAVRVPETPVSPEYVYYWLWSRYEQTRQVGAGNSQHALNKQKVEEIIFPLSPLAEQQEIVRRVERLFHIAEAIEKRTAAAAGRADRLTQAILAKAFRGELVPTEAELARAEGRGYEPASLLLERIRAEQKGRTGRATKPALCVTQSSNGL